MTGTTGTTPHVSASTPSITAVNRSGGANGLAASCTATIRVPDDEGVERRPHRGLPAHAPGDHLDGLAAPLDDACTRSSQPGGAVTISDPTAGDARGRSGRDGEDRSSPDREERLRLLGADPPSGARREHDGDHACGIVLHGGKHGRPAASA